MNTATRSFLTNRKVVALTAAAIGFVTGGVVGTLVTRRLFLNAMDEELTNMQHDAKMERLKRRLDPNFVQYDNPDGWRPGMDEEKYNESRSLRIASGLEKDFEVGRQHAEEMREAEERLHAARHHTFDTPTDDWDYEAERNIRESKEIYVIHRDEYIQDEMGFHQSTIEYYTQDGVMTDALQHPIHNYTDFVGHEALDQFGHGSGDSDVVYVRNHTEKAEFEVLRNHGSYEREVLGLEVEEEYRDQDLRHSRYPTHRFPIRE